MWAVVGIAFAVCSRTYKGKGATDVGCRKPWLMRCRDFLRDFQFSMSLTAPFSLRINNGEGGTDVGSPKPWLLPPTPLLLTTKFKEL